MGLSFAIFTVDSYRNVSAQKIKHGISRKSLKEHLLSTSFEPTSMMMFFLAVLNGGYLQQFLPTVVFQLSKYCLRLWLVTIELAWCSSYL